MTKHRELRQTTPNDAFTSRDAKHIAGKAMKALAYMDENQESPDVSPVTTNTINDVIATITQYEKPSKGIYTEILTRRKQPSVYNRIANQRGDDLSKAIRCGTLFKDTDQDLTPFRDHLVKSVRKYLPSDFVNKVTDYTASTSTPKRSRLSRPITPRLRRQAEQSKPTSNPHVSTSQPTNAIGIGNTPVRTWYENPMEPDRTL